MKNLLPVITSELRVKHYITQALHHTLQGTKMNCAKLLGYQVYKNHDFNSSFSICTSLCIWCVNTYENKKCSLNVLSGLNYGRYLDINYAFPRCAHYSCCKTTILQGIQFLLNIRALSEKYMHLPYRKLYTKLKMFYTSFNLIWVLRLFYTHLYLCPWHETGSFSHLVVVVPNILKISSCHFSSDLIKR